MTAFASDRIWMPPAHLYGRTDEEIESDVSLQVPRGKLCHTCDTIPKSPHRSSASSSFYEYRIDQVHVPVRLKRKAIEFETKKLRMRRLSSREIDDRLGIHEDLEEVPDLNLEEAIAIRRSLLQLIHPLNSPRRRIALSMLQNLAATYCYLLFEASDNVARRIERSDVSTAGGAINEWRLMSAVFRRLVGMRLKEAFPGQLADFVDYAIVGPHVRAVMGILGNCIKQAELKVLPALAYLTKDERTEQGAQWFNKFTLPSKGGASMTAKDYMHHIDQMVTRHLLDRERSKDRKRAKRDAKDLITFIKLYDNQYQDDKRRRYLKTFLKRGAEETKFIPETETETLEPTSESKVVGEDEREIPADFAKRFDGHPSYEVPTSLDAFDYWFNFLEDTGTSGWLARLEDPSLRIVELYKLEKGALHTVAGISAMLEVLTQPERYEDLFSLAKAGEVVKWQRPISCFQFFCDQTLAEFSRSIQRRGPHLLTWLERIPFLYDINISQLKNALTNPSQWIKSRKYIWHDKESLPSHLKLHPLAIHNTIRQLPTIESLTRTLSDSDRERIKSLAAKCVDYDDGAAV